MNSRPLSACLCDSGSAWNWRSRGPIHSEPGDDIRGHCIELAESIVLI